MNKNYDLYKKGEIYENLFLNKQFINSVRYIFKQA